MHYTIIGLFSEISDNYTLGSYQTWSGEGLQVWGVQLNANLLQNTYGFQYAKYNILSALLTIHLFIWIYVSVDLFTKLRLFKKHYVKFSLHNTHPSVFYQFSWCIYSYAQKKLFYRFQSLFYIYIGPNLFVCKYSYLND